MTRGDLSATGILNALVPHLRRAGGPAASVLILTALPLRLLVIHFVDLLDRLGGEAPHFGNLLTALATFIVVAFVFCIYGRAVFMRALQSPADSWRSLLRLNARSFAAYLYVSLMIEITLLLFSITVVAIPFAILLAGIAAAATADPPQIGLTAPLRTLAPYLQHGRVLAGLMFVFAVALIAAAVNLYFAGALLVWAAAAVPGFDSVRWSAAAAGSYRFRLAIIAAAITSVEPFFLAAMHVYGDRVRSQKSGEDLLKRFKSLTASKSIAAAIALCAFACVPLHAQDEKTISQSEYATQLRVIRDGLSSGRFADAVSAASDLQHIAVVTGNRGDFEPDRPLLRAAFTAATESKGDVIVIDRLTSTIEALGSGAHEESPAGDRNLLDRIRMRQRAADLPRGGELGDAPEASPTFVDAFQRIYDRFINWCAARLEGVYDWLRKIWPKPKEEEKRSDEFFGVPVVVWIVTSLIVATLLLVMIYVLRRSRRRVVPVLSEHLAASERDADPLSRESNEWERYARELTDSGRLREAIRAWYHAVLVTLYRGGVLHYRRGITNWEYVSALSPVHQWRPQFVSMTRQFDREWYGRHETTVEVLDSCAADARIILAAFRQGAR